MEKKKVVLLVGIFTLFGLIQISAQGPSRYACFQGNLTRDGKPAPVGTEITAFNSTGGEYTVEYGFAYKIGEYGTGASGPIHVSEGGDGDLISFKINGFSANEVIFCSLMTCGVQQLDLSCTNCNHAPALSDDAVDRASGDINTTFRYTVTYSDADNDAPLWVNVSLDGVSYKMPGNYSNASELDELKDSRIYWYETTLSEGSHNYKFTAYDGFSITETSLQEGPNVVIPGAVPGDTDGDGDISDLELLVYIEQWSQGLVEDVDLLTAIEYWAT